MLPYAIRRRSRALGLSSVVVIAVAGFAVAGVSMATASTGEVRQAGGPTAVAGSYLVVLKDTVVLTDSDGSTRTKTAMASTATKLAGAHGGTVGRVYSSALRGFEARLSEAEAKELAADPAVAYVEQNHTVSLADTQTNPPSWALDRADQRGKSLNSAYTYPSRGSGVRAYIIDSGMRFSHSDFGGRATTGYDAVDGGAADDCRGHGTAVSGIVGGAAHGMAKSVSMVAVRVFPCTGETATWAAVIAGVDWVTANAVKPAVANMSIGGVSSAMDEATANLIASGVTVVAAANNENTDACTSTPAKVPGAITVGATTRTDARASYSNYGSCVDLFAPGSEVTTTSYSSDTATVVSNGTSLAAPYVTGAAALVLAEHPSWTPKQVHDYLVSNATTGAVSDPGSGSPNRLLYGVSDLTGQSPSAMDYVPFATPVGVLDTRAGTGGVTGARGPASMTTFPVLGVGGIPSSGVGAVLARVAVNGASAATFVEVWADGRARPALSMVNVAAGENISNVAVVPVGANGKLTVYNNAGNADVIVDIQGYYPSTEAADRGFVPVTHTRLIDTRSGLGTSVGTIPAGGSRTVRITGGVVPTGASVAFVNLLVPGASTGGWLAAAPAGTSSGRGVLNYVTGSTQSAAAIKLASDGRVTFFNKGSIAVNLVVAVQGYYSASASAGSALVPAASRLINTRTAGSGTPVPAGGTLDVQVAGVNGVPATAVAAALNLTVTGPLQAGYLQAWPVGQSTPSVTVMDFNAGDWRANAVILAPGTDGKIRIRNGSSGTIHVIVDRQGWYA